MDGTSLTDTTPGGDQVGGLLNGVRSVEVPREVPPSSATILKAEASMHTELAQLRASLHAQMEATIVRRALELQARIDVMKQVQERVASESSGTAHATTVSDTNYKTMLCQKWGAWGTCPFADKCQFAHGETELRVAASKQGEGAVIGKRKTKPCWHFSVQGTCRYGVSCAFLHPTDVDLSTGQHKVTAPSGLIQPPSIATLLQVDAAKGLAPISQNTSTLVVPPPLPSQTAAPGALYGPPSVLRKQTTNEPNNAKRCAPHQLRPLPTIPYEEQTAKRSRLCGTAAGSEH
eukprot:m.56610 g.56610  ORF g.56610 m.56610 type:complete len:290 (-) comp16997_c0_seq1:293-1162(-)